MITYYIAFFSILAWQHLNGVTDGSSSYYRTFIRNYAEITEPLMRLTRGSVKFVWREEQSVAFEQLKIKLKQGPALVFADFSRVYYHN